MAILTSHPLLPQILATEFNSQKRVSSFLPLSRRNQEQVKVSVFLPWDDVGKADGGSSSELYSMAGAVGRRI